MVVGGEPITAHRKVEIIDISGQKLTCPSIPDFPVDYGSVGVFINNKAMVCGGHQTVSDDYVSDCYSYNMEVILYFKIELYFPLLK